MPDLKLTMAMTPWDRIGPLLTGEVKPEGIALEHHDIPLQDIWRRQLQGNEFDISEMSMSFTLQAIPLGWDYRVLPVFHNRTFSYVNTMIRLGAGIRQDHPRRDGRQTRRRRRLPDDGGALDARHPRARVRRRPT